MSQDPPPKNKKENKGRKKYLAPELTAAGTLSAAALSAQAGVASSRMFKKNIKLMAGRDYASMLEKLDAVKLYRFRYKTDGKSEKLRMGVIAEEAPSEITDRRRLTIDIGSALGFIMAGIKAQEDRRRRLEKAIAEQGRQIRSLLNRINAS